ncbi:hypothetical protein [Streptomyces sp. NPDC047718]|uniref:hypothetical protein n=1 Tax=Streptomyces sp. NPDC047718 TaxID=3155479 RepID=UPI0033DF1A90
MVIWGADGVVLGFECQRSEENPRNILRRDAVARRNEIQDAWQTDKRRIVRDNPKVPFLRTDQLPPELISRRTNPLPFRGGIRRIEMVRCDERSVVPCPRWGAGRCNRWHPQTQPVEVPFDDFIRGAASGLYVRFRLPGRQLGGIEFWTPVEGRNAFLDSVDGQVELEPAPVPAQREPLEGMAEGDATCRTRGDALGSGVRQEPEDVEDQVELAPVPVPMEPSEDTVVVRPSASAFAAPVLAAPVPGRCECECATVKCSGTVRLYPAGWRCDTYKPYVHHPRPATPALVDPVAAEQAANEERARAPAEEKYRQAVATRTAKREAAERARREELERLAPFLERAGLDPARWDRFKAMVCSVSGKDVSFTSTSPAYGGGLVACTPSRAEGGQELAGVVCPRPAARGPGNVGGAYHGARAQQGMVGAHRGCGPGGDQGRGVGPGEGRTQFVRVPAAPRRSVQPCG